MCFVVRLSKYIPRIRSSKCAYLNFGCGCMQHIRYWDKLYMSIYFVKLHWITILLHYVSYFLLISIKYYIDSKKFFEYSNLESMYVYKKTIFFLKNAIYGESTLLGLSNDIYISITVWVSSKKQPDTMKRHF